MPGGALALAAAVGLLLAGASGAGAQTPLPAVGLGYPVPALDARAAAMGGVGSGLLGGTFSVRNPADLVEISRPGLSMSAAPEGVSVKGPGRSFGADRSRFSVLRAVVPLGRWRTSVAFAGELDQDWRFRFRDTLSTSQGRFPFTEQREADGGLSSVDVSLARRIGPVSLGVSYQLLTGSVRRSLTRRFEVSVDSTQAPPGPVEEEAGWNYSGFRLKAGAGVELGDRVRVSASYGWTDELTVERDSLDVTRTVEMPSEAELGVSARLSDAWLVAAAGGWTGWSASRGSLSGVRVEDAYWGGAGVELRGVELGPLPALRLRAGGRLRDLPFTRPDKPAPVERALTLGLGSRFGGGAAALDLALEFGSRGDASEIGLEESFTRLTLTATVLR